MNRLSNEGFQAVFSNRFWKEHSFATALVNFFIESRGAFHLPELAGQIGLFVNRMRHFKGLFFDIFFKMAHSENGMRHFERIQWTSIKPVLQTDAFHLQTDWSGRPVPTKGKCSK